jgi:hypothetical protein
MYSHKAVAALSDKVMISMHSLQKIFVGLAVSAVSLLFTACTYDAEFAAFRSLPRENQHIEFQQFPLNKQIDYYLYCMASEPPDPIFTNDIVVQGITVVPVLLQRIASEKSDHRKYFIIVLLEQINQQPTPLNNRQEIRDKLTPEIDNMKDQFWKEQATQSLNHILNR